MAGSGEQYYSAGENLRQSIRQLRADERFATGEGTTFSSRELLYIFDTNIVEAYLETRSDVDVGPVSLDRLFADEQAVRVSNRLTIEYLLSGGLPGQRTRQCYLSAFHWDETLNRADRLASDVLRDSKHVVSGERGRQLEALHLQTISDAKTFIQEAGKIVPDRIVKGLSQARAVRLRLQRAFSRTDSGWLDALETNEYWGAAGDHVLRSDYLRWRTDLQREREAAHKGRKTAAKEKPSEQALKDQGRRIDNDASTLAGIEAMYRENPEACGDGASVQFLFVTADRAILRLAEAYRAQWEEQGIPFFVRHPSVYSPLICFSNMARALSSEPATDVPDDIKAVFLSVERAAEQLVEFEEAKQVYSQQSSSKTISTMVRQWSAAARQLVTVHSKFFAPDVEDDFEGLADRLSQPATLTAAGHLLREMIGEIRRSHTHLLSDHALNYLSANLTALAAQNGAPDARRAPVKIVGVNLLAGVPSASGHDLRHGEVAHGLDELLDHVLREQRPGQINVTIEALRRKLKSEWASPNTQLLASCIYLAIGAWQSARDCAGWAKVLAQSHGPAFESVVWREANYCGALASRFILRTAADFNDASSALQTNLGNWALSRERNTALAILRDMIERAALLQAGSVLQAIEDNTPFETFGPTDVPVELMPSEDISIHFDEAVAMMERCARIMDSDYSGDTTAPYLVTQLKRQLYINLSGAHVFRCVLGAKVSASKVDLDALRTTMERLDELGTPGKPMPHIAKVYLTLGRYFASGDTREIEATAQLISQVLQKDDLPYGDKAELRFLSARAPFSQAETLTTVEQRG